MIISTCRNFVLEQDDDAKDHFLFYSPPLSVWGCPVNQYGTRDEVIAELKRWKKEVDFNNSKMIEVENKFISVLEGKEQLCPA